MSIGFVGSYMIRAVSILNIKLSTLSYLIIAIYLLILMRVVSGLIDKVPSRLWTHIVYTCSSWSREDVEP